MGDIDENQVSIKQKIAQKQAEIAISKIKRTIPQKHGYILVLSLIILGIIIGSTYTFLGITLKTKIVIIENSQDMVAVVSAASSLDIEMPESQISTPSKDTSSDTSSVASLIAKIAKEENFENIDGLLRLSMCESSLGRAIVNKNNDKRKTTDRGIWMINDYWHSEVTDAQAYDNDWATRWTINRIKAGYLYEWNCSGVWDDNNYEVK